MKSKSFYRTLCSIFLLLILTVNALPQYLLGRHALTSSGAPPLANPMRVTLSGSRGRGAALPLGFLMKIGGVAFDGVASPAAGTPVSDIKLGYLPKRLDGNRLAITVNGRPVSAPIYDWQLVPIAKFADSTFFSCFTLVDQDAEGKRMYRYHPDLNDTLLGLRLFQLDLLVINEDAYELPKLNGRYILGAGERAPATAKTEEALILAQLYLRVLSAAEGGWNSYLISNRDRETVFSFVNGRLRLTEAPTYFFWSLEEDKLNNLENGTALKNEKATVANEVQEIPESGRKEWLIRNVLAEAKKYQAEINSDDLLKEYEGDRIQKLIAVTEGPQRVDYLQNMSLEELQTELSELRAFNYSLKPVERPELSARLSGETAMLRAINPAVWDAGVAVMRYSAFFRYCKERDPANWRAFMEQVKNVQTRPAVRTPNYMEGEY